MLEVDDKCDMTDDAAKMVMEAANMVTDASKKADEASNVDIEAAEKAEMAALKVEMDKERHRDVAQVFDKVEEEMNLALKELKTVAATSALSCGTGGRTANEKSYVDAAVAILCNEATSDMEEEDAFEEVTIEAK